MAAKAREEKAREHDVLTYLDRPGMQGCVWYSKPTEWAGERARMSVPVHVRHVIQPRLDICPAAMWDAVKESQGYIDLGQRGEIKVFNPTGSIEEGWSRAPTRSLVKMIEKSAGIEVLLRLQAIESDSDQPRLEVSEEIDARLKDLKVKLAKHQHKRATQRRANRRLSA